SERRAVRHQRNGAHRTKHSRSCVHTNPPAAMVATTVPEGLVPECGVKMKELTSGGSRTNPAQYRSRTQPHAPLSPRMRRATAGVATTRLYSAQRSATLAT